MAAAASIRPLSPQVPPASEPPVVRAPRAPADLPLPPAPVPGTALLTVVATLAGALLVAGVRTESVQLTYELDRVVAARARAAKDIERLDAELAALRAPEQLAAASTALGLRPPDPGQVRLVELP